MRQCVQDSDDVKTNITCMSTAWICRQHVFSNYFYFLCHVLDFTSYNWVNCLAIGNVF